MVVAGAVVLSLLLSNMGLIIALFMDVSLNRPYLGCGSDEGWLLITDLHCPWEQRMAKRSIQYTTLSTSTNWNTYG